jgi:paraquat-inducible protein B
MFTGSISFATPAQRSAAAKPVEKNQSFRIYGSYAEAVQKVPALQQPGLSVRLRTADPASLSVGSPLLYKSMEIGRVTGFQLAAKKNEVFIDCFIDRKHADLVG